MRKKILAYLPAWGFFWLGHGVSLIIGWSEHMEWLYPTYSLFMGWSVFFNDWGGLDVWVDSVEENE